MSEDKFQFSAIHRSMLKVKWAACKVGPRQANLVLIAYASSEGSGEPVVKICHDGMLEDTNSLDGAQLM